MNAFDPSYGYTLDTLLAVPAPERPNDFATFWQRRYTQIAERDPGASLQNAGRKIGGFQLHHLQYHSTDDVLIRGWALLPECDFQRVMIVGHGYGGCHEPNPELPLADAAYLFPCSRGIGLSRSPGLPEAPDQHVLQSIDHRDHYILGGCVDDLWLGVSAALQLFPQCRDHVGLMGISFSGGIGALALPWDCRISYAHFQVPSFGHQPLRLQLPSWGSAGSVQRYAQQHPDVLSTLIWFDAASAAHYIKQPVHIAAALQDPAVAPPGQFAIYNALQHQRKLFVLAKGHMDYPAQAKEQAALLAELKDFFQAL